MKNISLFLNVIILLAVGLLFYWHFSTPKSQQMESTHTVAQGSLSGIYYVNNDSLWNNYEFVKTSVVELGLERTRLENEFKRSYEKLANEVTTFQTGIQKGLFSEESAGKRQQELAMAEQNLMQDKDRMSNKLIELEYEMDKKIRIAIHDFLVEKSKELNVQYILGYSMTAGGALLYGNDSLEITKEITEELNKRYLEANPVKTKK